jgi:hypothetical protein
MLNSTLRRASGRGREHFNKEAPPQFAAKGMKPSATVQGVFCQAL